MLCAGAQRCSASLPYLAGCPPGESPARRSSTWPFSFNARVGRKGVRCIFARLAKGSRLLALDDGITVFWFCSVLWLFHLRGRELQSRLCVSSCCN